MRATSSSFRRREDDSWVAFHANALQVCVTASKDSRNLQSCSWRLSYAPGRMLGDGVSAKVYEAEAMAPSRTQAAPPLLQDGWFSSSCGAGLGVTQCFRERSRRVAIKRYHKAGSKTFMKELAAMRRVGIHPNVLRLLESYQGFGGEDVLVLEYCNGSTLYDLYAREHASGGIPERLIARLMRQLMLALEHIHSRGVEHQDVKPENMMLYDVSVIQCTGDLKIGDFGWAALAPPPGTMANRPPSSGAGSLWYAPPELNPPVLGIALVSDPPEVDEFGNDMLLGRCDMWSAGVVLYLLCVGHNPFNAALQKLAPEAVDDEVLRLAAAGSFNRRSERWITLAEETQDLIALMIAVPRRARPSATVVLKHNFFSKRANAKGSEGSIFFHGVGPSWLDHQEIWGRMDGLQRLGWTAVARAVSECELDRGVVNSALLAEAQEKRRLSQLAGASSSSLHREASYLWQLARELATTPVFQWIQDKGNWAEIMALGFRYLDVDGDGRLGVEDLLAHVENRTVEASLAAGGGSGTGEAIVGRDAERNVRNQVCQWVARWQEAAAHSSAPGYLLLSHFREALLSACYRGVDSALYEDTAGDMATAAVIADATVHHEALPEFPTWSWNSADDRVKRGREPPSMATGHETWQLRPEEDSHGSQML